MATKRSHSPETSSPSKRAKYQDLTLDSFREALILIRNSDPKTRTFFLNNDDPSREDCITFVKPLYEQLSKEIFDEIIPFPSKPEAHFLSIYGDLFRTDRDHPPDRHSARILFDRTVVAEAVKTAWLSDYIGNRHLLLLRYIEQIFTSADFSRAHKNYLVIIQGSGTGKSRIVDKVAEVVLTIPLVLRADDDKPGYPAGDITAENKSVLAFFHDSENGTEDHISKRYLLFLLKLIRYALDWVRSFKAKHPNNLDSIPLDWKNHIGISASAARQEMFKYAVSDTPLQGFKNLENIAEADLCEKAGELIGELRNELRHDRSRPSIIFYFDEAHNLTSKDVTTSGAQRTSYQCLCKAFTFLRNTDVFGVFLSTYSRLSILAPSRKKHWSDRLAKRQEVDFDLNAPFVELPFDCWKERFLHEEGKDSIDKICSLEFKMRFGRPLFWTLMNNDSENTTKVVEILDYARHKLRFRAEDADRLLPLLASRIDLTFESNRDEAVRLDSLLVATSMRTVYSVPQHREYLRGGYPSEPFLSEAAAREILAYMKKTASFGDGNPVPTEKVVQTYNSTIPRVINHWLNRGLIEKGQRGELVARILLTLAHDAAILRTYAAGTLSQVGPSSSNHESDTHPAFPCAGTPDDPGNLSHVSSPSHKSDTHPAFPLETHTADQAEPPADIPVSTGLVEDKHISFSRRLSVIDFLRSLIPPEMIETVLNARPRNMKGKTLREAFKNAYVNFTHFVKAGDAFAITDDGAYVFFVRGAAVQGHSTLISIDLYIPVVFLDESECPSRWSMSGIFIQVKNCLDKKFISIDVQKQFSFFSFSEKRSHNQRPYITIAMELGILPRDERPDPPVRMEKTSEKANVILT
ncbi:hypothetical protein H0H93_013939 [Arthromyces matolae]|nr:hypothetical protein H0H93_013939 [Arthromyces matolae]